MENETLDHVTKVIAYHPRYLEHYLKTQHFILNCDGPLSEPYRHYLAIMAAARHDCSYLVNLHEKKFLQARGDPKWLNGLEFVPQKLRAIYEINKILCHRPWLLNKEHIERLTKGSFNWSLSEVVHAIVILAHFHSLASFVFSCGLTQELDTNTTSSQSIYNSLCNNYSGNNINGINGTNLIESTDQVTIESINHYNQQQIFSPTVPMGQIAKVDALMERMKVLSQKSDECCSETELSNRFKNVEMQAAELSIQTTTTEPPKIYTQYVDDPTFKYQDFARRGAENVPTTFRVQDYSWEDHGLSLVSQLYNDVGYLLDDKFRTAYNLTYYTIAGRQNVDTSKFRRAIWNYIQCIYGIRHDDYDYGEVNQLLDRQLKMFIKTACCFPERITKKDYDSVLLELQHSEKVSDQLN
uniref:CSON005879 protein n=1 Tax=Culicoides sonorensis TaxID=179676 RepID=A0A336N032_CULSO